MRLSKRAQANAIEIYKILERISSPADMHLLSRRKRKTTTNVGRAVKPRHSAPILAPTFAPLEHRPKDINEFLLAMCFHIEGMFAYTANITPSPDEVTLIIDSGASISISPHRGDFPLGIRPVRSATLQGIAGGCDVKGIGTVRYYLPRLKQPPFELTIENVLYVPSCPSRLLCPQQLHAASTLKGPDNASFLTYEGGATLTHKGEQFTFSLRACLS